MSTNHNGDKSYRCTTKCVFFESQRTQRMTGGYATHGTRQTSPWRRNNSQQSRNKHGWNAAKGLSTDPDISLKNEMTASMFNTVSHLKWQNSASTHEFVGKNSAENLRLDKVLSVTLRTAQWDSSTCSGGKPDLPTLLHWQLVFHHSSIVTLSLPVILISNVIFPASSNQFGFSLLEMDHYGIEREFQQSRALSRL